MKYYIKNKEIEAYQLTYENVHFIMGLLQKAGLCPVIRMEFDHSCIETDRGVLFWRDYVVRMNNQLVFYSKYLFEDKYEKAKPPKVIASESGKVIAVDFDGTLCESKWPDIGEPNLEVIKYILQQRCEGAKLILWTCRCGKMLDDAIKWCKEEQGLVFDAVNSNIPEIMDLYGSESRKISADEYIDDKMCTQFELPYVHVEPKSCVWNQGQLKVLGKVDTVKYQCPSGLVITCSQHKGESTELLSFSELCNNFVSLNDNELDINYFGRYPHVPNSLIVWTTDRKAQVFTYVRDNTFEYFKKIENPKKCEDLKDGNRLEKQRRRGY